MFSFPTFSLDTSHARTRSVRIVHDTCPTCVQPLDRPHRRLSANGMVLEGCVDGCHSPFLLPGSTSWAWHHRPDAYHTRVKLARFAC